LISALYFVHRKERRAPKEKFSFILARSLVRNARDSTYSRRLIYILTLAILYSCREKQEKIKRYTNITQIKTHDLEYPLCLLNLLPFSFSIARVSKTSVLTSRSNTLKRFKLRMCRSNTLRRFELRTCF